MRTINDIQPAARPLLVIAAAAALLSLSLMTPRAEAAFPGENGDITFDRFFKGGEEIFSIDPESGATRRLTSDAIASGGDVAANDPAYSPDGSQIVFVNAVRRAGESSRANDVFVMSADGSDPRRVTRTDGRELDPAFSADGSTIAFKRGREVYAIDADGTNERLLTGDVRRKAGEPVFSPDGTKVALTVNTGGDPDIVLLDIDGSDPVNLTPARVGIDRSPAFSPDGSQIVFIGEDPDGPALDLYIVDTAGSEPQQVPLDPSVQLVNLGDLGEVAYSPDATKLLFTGQVGANGPTRPFTVDVSGGAAEKLGGAKMINTYNHDWGVAAP